MKAVLPAVQLLLSILMVIAANACGDDSGTGPSMQSVAGSYTASSFTVTESGNTTDVLALGASIDVTLNRNGTTTGNFFLPGGEEDGSDFNADLSGTWSLNGTTVSFSHSANTFLPEVPFEVDGETLTGEQTFVGALVRATLRKD